ncbi:MAG: CsgG/HfaB family protein [Fuerstiella sp.]
MRQFLLTALWISFAAGNASLITADTRVAMIGSSGKSPDGSVTALVEVALAAKEDIIVLERQQLHLLLSEQSLSLQGPVRAEDIVKAGQLLAVDLFAFVEQSEDGKESLACVVYDATTGIRLCDQSLAKEEADKIANQVVACVEVAAQKRSADRSELRTISVVGVRNADLPQSMDTICRSLAMLFERNLVEAKNFAVLERSRLASLQQEQNLSSTAANSELVSSVLQADIEFSKSEDGVQATLLVTDSLGRQVHKSTSTAQLLDLSLMVPLVESLSRGLKLSHSHSVPNRRYESERYYREAKQRWSYGDKEEAIQCAEAAWLLDPDKLHNASLLAEYLFLLGASESHALWRGRENLRLTDYRPIFAVTERAADLFLLHVQQSLANSQKSIYSYSRMTHGLQQACNVFFATLPQKKFIHEADRAEWQETRSQLFRRMLEISCAKLNACRDEALKTPAGGSPNEWGGPRWYSISISNERHNLRQQTEDKTQWLSAVVEQVNTWLDDFDNFTPQSKPHRYVTNVLRDLTDQRLTHIDVNSNWDSLLKRLAQHENPVIQFYGRRGLMFAGASESTDDSEKLLLQFRPILQDVSEYLAKPLSAYSFRIRIALYEFLYESFNRFSLTPAHVEELESVCEKMLDRNELHVRLIAEWARKSQNSDNNGVARGLAMVERAIQLSDTKQYQWIDNHDPAETASLLRKTKSALLPGRTNMGTDSVTWEFQTTPLKDLTSLNDYRSILCHPVVSDETVHVVVQAPSQTHRRTDGQQLRIASIPLSGATEDLTDAVDIDFNMNGSYSLTQLVTDSCLHKERLYVSTRTGIVEFNLQTKQARMIPASASLPTAGVLSVKSLGDRIFAGLEGGYLVSFKPNSRTCVVHVSSRRKNKRTALDDREAFRITNLAPDKRNGRLFLQCETKTENNLTTEIWEYRPDTEACRRLVQNERNPLFLSQASQGKILINTRYWMQVIDLSTDLLVEQRLTASRIPVNAVYLRNPVVCDGRIWSINGQSPTGSLTSCSLSGGDEHVVPFNFPPLSRAEFNAGWYAAPVDNKRFLLSNHHRLWLVTPDKLKDAQPKLRQRP